MSRQEQIESLAKAWEALEERSWVEDKEPDVFHFFKGEDETPVTVLWAGGTDTDDATPCLAILRDVYGEENDIAHHKAPPHGQFPNGKEGWQCRPIDITDSGWGWSKVSRIDAVRLALEARTTPNDDEGKRPGVSTNEVSVPSKEVL